MNPLVVKTDFNINIYLNTYKENISHIHSYKITTPKDMEKRFSGSYSSQRSSRRWLIENAGKRETTTAVESSHKYVINRTPNLLFDYRILEFYENLPYNLEFQKYTDPIRFRNASWNLVIIWRSVQNSHSISTTFNVYYIEFQACFINWRNANYGELKT